MALKGINSKVNLEQKKNIFADSFVNEVIQTCCTKNGLHKYYLFNLFQLVSIKVNCQRGNKTT